MFDFIAGVDREGQDPHRPHPPASEAQVQALEGIIGRRHPGARLPGPYRHFLMTVNGGMPDPRQIADGALCMDGVRRDGRVERHALDGLFSLARSQLGEQAEWWAKDDWLGEAPAFFSYIPDDLFPIGYAMHDCSAIEWLVISVHGPRHGRVYVLQIDMEGICRGDFVGWSDAVRDRPPHARYDPFDYLFHVADDFDGFLAGLYLCPDA